MFLSGELGETMQLEAIYVYCHFADVTDVDMAGEKCSFCDRIKSMEKALSMLIESRI